MCIGRGKKGVPGTPSPEVEQLNVKLRITDLNAYSCFVVFIVSVVLMDYRHNSYFCVNEMLAVIDAHDFT